MKYAFNNKQPSRGVLIKRCSKNMQEIHRRTPLPKCDFNKVGLQLFCNFIEVTFRTLFSKNISGGLLLFNDS